MDNPPLDPTTAAQHVQLLSTLEGLLAIQATEVRPVLTQAAQLVVEALRADKADVFLYDSASDTLVAMGTSDTPMGRKQITLGLNRLAVSNGGKTVRVFLAGESFVTGHLDQEDEVPGIPGALGVRSAIAVPLEIAGTRRGVVEVNTAQPEHFTTEDVRFLEAVAQWIGMVLHRAELVERLTEEAAMRARQVTADELVTILAHDMRGPLTALKGRAAILHMRAEREGHAANLNDAVALTRAANRLDQMISDLLDAARLEQGIFSVTPTIIDLALLARETAAGLQTHNDEIVVRTPDEVLVEGDPDRIRQLLENLLTNARRHSPADVAVILEVGTETRTDGVWAVITVRDFGPGIAPDMQPNLFTRYAAGKGTKGLGLGLYLAQGIAQAHGGTLSMDSPPGEGATFRLALPLPTT